MNSIGKMILVLASVLITYCMAACDQAISVAEYNALQSFYNLTNGKNWNWRNDSSSGIPWNFTAAHVGDDYLKGPCADNWQGVSCGAYLDTCFVFALDLVEYNIRGHLAFELGNLANISFIDLGLNGITGTVPSSFGNLKRLKTLALDFNYLTGTIPSSLANSLSLEAIDLYSNLLTGSIASGLGNLRNLYYLDFCFNSLTSTIPSEILNIESLLSVLLAENFLSGIIPQLIGSTRLISLELAANPLTGPIPSSLGNLQQLIYLSFANNIFSSSIPSSIGKLTRLVDLIIQNCSVTGTLPRSIGNLTNLLSLALDRNFITGGIPTSIGNLVQLVNLFLDTNRFSGTIPSIMGSLKRLQDLYVETNLLTGGVPSSLGSLANLGVLYFNSNFLTGFIPRGLQNLSKLQYLNMGYNHFSGTGPSWAGSLEKLIGLYFNDNHFSGDLNNLMFSGAKFSSITSLDFADNLFTGTFPSGVFSIRKILTLSGSRNCFKGALRVALPADRTDSSLLQTVDLDGLSSGTGCRNYLVQLPGIVPDPGYTPFNYMTGPIPSVLWSLPLLQEVSLVGNGFTGRLYTGDFDPQSSSLQNVNLAYNRLTGTLPLAFQQYGRFQSLDVSYNAFSGTLEADFNFSRAFSSGLSLSVNRLSGSFPTGSNSVLSSSNVIGNVLQGNLFSFDVEQISPAVRAEATIYNGSSELNAAMVFSGFAVLVWAALLLLLLIAKTAVDREALLTGVDHAGSKVGQQNVPRRTLLVWWHQLCRWYQWAGVAGDLREHQKLLRVTSLLSSLICAALGSCALLSVAFLVMKLQPQYKPIYATYQVQYSWVLSSAFLHDSPPAAICAAVLCGLSILIAVRLFPFSYKPVRDSSESSSRVCGVTRKHWLKRLKLALFSGINMVVILVLNALYLQTVISSSPNLILIQISVACFKFGWNKTFLTWAQLYLNNGIDDELEHLCLLQLLMSLFNFIIAPCIATGFSDRACLYALFKHQSAVATSSKPICNVFRLNPSTDEIECVAYVGSLSLAEPFDPPFIYGYECGSVLIVNYVPVLLYIFFLSSVVVPGCVLLALVFRSRVDSWMPRWAKRKLFSPVFLMELNEQLTQRNCLEDAVNMEGQFDIAAFEGRGDESSSQSNHDTTNSSASASATAAGKGNPTRLANALQAGVSLYNDSGNQRKAQRVYNAGFMISQLVLHLVVMLTFGLAAPFLAVVVGCSFFAQVWTARILVGRYLYYHATTGEPRDKLLVFDESLGASVEQAQDAGAASSLNFGLDGHNIANHGVGLDLTSQVYQAACKSINRVTSNVWIFPFQRCWVVLFVAHVFWGLLSFDMVGDVYGYSAGLVTMVVVISGAPLLTYWGARVILQLPPLPPLQSLQSLLLSFVAATFDFWAGERTDGLVSEEKGDKLNRAQRAHGAPGGDPSSHAEEDDPGAQSWSQSRIQE